ncbi:MAG: ABC transporter permease [Bacteroidota bacterium]
MLNQSFREGFHKVNPFKNLSYINFIGLSSALFGLLLILFSINELESELLYQPSGQISVGPITLPIDARYIHPKHLEYFCLELLEGDSLNPLPNNQSVLLSNELAQRLFEQTQGLVGKTIHWQQGQLEGRYTISGIFKKPTCDTALPFDVFFTINRYAHLQY